MHSLRDRLLDFLTFIFFWGGVERGLDSPMTPHFLGLPSHHHHHTEQKGRRLPFFGPLFIAPYIMRLSFVGVLLVGKKKETRKKKEKKKKWTFFYLSIQRVVLECVRNKEKKAFANKRARYYTHSLAHHFTRERRRPPPPPPTTTTTTPCTEARGRKASVGSSNTRRARRTCLGRKRKTRTRRRRRSWKRF